ncbi:hypothetical protein Tco_0720919 [Tanacetum coccineum]
MASQENIKHRAPAMTKDATSTTVADSVAIALKALAAYLAQITNNTNKNTRTSGTPVARKGINDHKRKSLHCQVSKLQQGGSSDQKTAMQRPAKGSNLYQCL